MANYDFSINNFIKSSGYEQGFQYEEYIVIKSFNYVVVSMVVHCPLSSLLLKKLKFAVLLLLYKHINMIHQNFLSCLMF